MNFIECFSIPILVNKLDLNLTDIKKYCLSVEKNSSGRKFSNYGGFQSHDLCVDDYTSGVLSPLSNKIIENTSLFAKKFDLKEPFDIILKNMWVNVNRKGNFNKPHVHPGSFISGVFYVNYPEDGGNIKFINPSGLVHTVDRRVQVVSSHNKFNSIEYFIEPHSNILLLFNSHLHHYVESNNSSEPRISISFNLSVEYVGEHD